MKRPKGFVHEMSDYADEVNGGEEVRMVIAMLSEEYVVYKQILAMADYGDCCHRKRLVLVGFRKDFGGAHEWEVPAAKYGAWKPHCARDIAEPDDDVADEDKRTRQLHTVYADVPVSPFGQLQKLGRLFPGFKMGPGCNPYLCLGWDGTKNGPTTHRGGGTFPPLWWKQDMPLPYRRVTTMTEYYREVSLSETVQGWHEKFAADKAEQQAWLADGFFAGTVHALCESIFALLEKYGEQRDMPAVFSEPGCYVTVRASVEAHEHSWG